MTNITIPPEALEAAARAICEADFNLPHDTPDFHVYARAACLAMLRAWPNRKDEWRDNITFDGKPIRYSVIILPLTESQNDKG